MDNKASSNGNKEYKAYHQGDFYDGLLQADKEAYTAGTIRCKGKRRVIPEHILKLMAQPEHRDEVLATLGHNPDGSAIEPTSPGMPRYYSRLKAEAAATCYVCNTLYKLSAIKYHKPISIGPEQPICTWCYRALKDASQLVPSPTPGNRASQGFTGTKAKSLENKLALAWVVLEQMSAAGLATTEQVYIYMVYLKEDNRIELYFDKNDKLMADQQLVEDFIDQLAHPSDQANLEEFEYIL